LGYEGNRGRDWHQIPPSRYLEIEAWSDRSWAPLSIFRRGFTGNREQPGPIGPDSSAIDEAGYRRRTAAGETEGA